MPRPIGYNLIETAAYLAYDVASCQPPAHFDPRRINKLNAEVLSAFGNLADAIEEIARCAINNTKTLQDVRFSFPRLVKYPANDRHIKM